MSHPLINNMEDGPPRTSFKTNCHHPHHCASGERFPVFIDVNGVIERAPCTQMSMIRRKTNSVNSRLQNLRGATALIHYARSIEISLSERVASGAFLDVGEQAGFDTYLQEETGANAKTRNRRHHDAMEFMRFLWRRYGASLKGNPEERIRYLVLAREFEDEFRAVIPSGGEGGEMRLGLTPEARAALVRFLLDPQAVSALWPDQFQAEGNVFLLFCFLLLGHRVGEFLSLRLGDFDVGARLYRICRLHNDPDDPRTLQPLTKGYERELRWPKALARRRDAYVRSRSKRPTSHRHDFLFVAAGGAPLSVSTVAKIFKDLHKHLPILGDRFSPHVLRHSWNDMFSEAADRAGLTSEREIRARMLAMGWVSRKTATTYTRRSDAKAVDDVSLSIQQQLFGAGDWP